MFHLKNIQTENDVCVFDYPLIEPLYEQITLLKSTIMQLNFMKVQLQFEYNSLDLYSLTIEQAFDELCEENAKLQTEIDELRRNNRLSKQPTCTIQTVMIVMFAFLLVCL